MFHFLSLWRAWFRQGDLLFRRIEKGAFKNSGAKKIILTGSAKNITFDKGALKGAGGENGKGLKIMVQTKKDKKIMKKVAKKNGLKKAKIVVAK